MVPADVITRLAAYYGCPPSVITVVWDQAVAAFRQAMTEFGVTGPPCGCCPAADCERCAMELRITERAYQLLGIGGLTR